MPQTSSTTSNHGGSGPTGARPAAPAHRSSGFSADSR